EDRDVGARRTCGAGDQEQCRPTPYFCRALNRDSSLERGHDRNIPRYITLGNEDPHALRPRVMFCVSRRWILGVGIEKLLPVDLVAGDRLLAFGRDHPVDELLAEFLFHIRM